MGNVGGLSGSVRSTRVDFAFDASAGGRIPRTIYHTSRLFFCLSSHPRYLPIYNHHWPTLNPHRFQPFAVDEFVDEMMKVYEEFVRREVGIAMMTWVARRFEHNLELMVFVGGWEMEDSGVKKTISY